MSSREPEPLPLPPYSYVPGGRWPHPISSPLGHLHGRVPERPPAIEGDAWPDSKAYLRGVQLFNAGYYWEAHEAWEALWHAHGRRGAVATVLQGLIKLAAAGVKIREGRATGARTHARRAAEHFAEAASTGGPDQLGLDLREWIGHAESIADRPPVDRGPADSAVHRVFSFRIAPRVSP
jgi:predicted metal-dependent hydrolase